MDSKSEKKAEEFRLRHEAEFRLANKVSQGEWDLAEEMEADLQSLLLAEFWGLYRRDHKRGKGK